MSADKMVDALLLAQEFIANELANREAGMEEGSDYVQEARAVLKAVRQALRVEGDDPAPAQTLDELCDTIGAALRVEGDDDR